MNHPSLTGTRCAMCGLKLVSAIGDQNIKVCPHCDLPCLNTRCELEPCEGRTKGNR